MNILSQYYIIYEITALPDILFFQMVKADEILEFSGFHIPTYLSGGLIEARISLFSSEGDLVEMSSKLLPGFPSTVAAYCNLIPLKLINNMLQEKRLRGTDASPLSSV